ncbi:MAG: CinA family protein [Candidatus Thorarchaeota archaeon]
MADQQSSEFNLLESSREIVAHIAHRLVKQNATLMVAESATGGLIQHLITQIPGSSEFYQGGIITYSNELKHRLLQVPESTLEKYGAVSHETVAAMANGVRLWMNTDYGLASTGIAGPTGGSSSKPVGLVFVAVSHHSFETVIQQHNFVGTRYDNKLNFSRVALQLLLDVIKKED